MEEKIETVKSLENWMVKNKYQKSAYTIGHYFFTTEGYGLEESSGLFYWFFSERGHKEIIKYFATEKEAVQYAFKKISLNL